MKILLTSTAFQPGGLVPPKYTCDGDNVSPPLTWKSIPTEAQSLALIMDDPDAPKGTWVHWVIYNIPPNEPGLPEDVLPYENFASGAKQGINDFKEIGYGGPCPPNGTHRYIFKIYALDTELSVPSGITKEQLERSMRGHIIAEGQLMARYHR